MLSTTATAVKAKGTMKTFVVRVYRQSPESGQDLVGLVEHVGEERQSPFRNFEELRGILTAPPGGRAIEQSACKRRKKTDRTEGRNP